MGFESAMSAAVSREGPWRGKSDGADRAQRRCQVPRFASIAEIVDYELPLIVATLRPFPSPIAPTETRHQPRRPWKQ
jgi:hypothetical protein